MMGLLGLMVHEKLNEIDMVAGKFPSRVRAIPSGNLLSDSSSNVCPTFQTFPSLVC